MPDVKDASSLIDNADIETEFIRRLGQLNRTEITWMRREGGRAMSDVSSQKSYIGFYKSLPAGAVKTGGEECAPEDVWFQAACIIAEIIAQQENRDEPGSPIPLASALAKMDAKAGSDLMGKRMTAALDTSWTEDGYAAQLVYRLVRSALNDEHNIDTTQILHDALHWNDAGQNVAFRWTDDYNAQKR